MRNPLAQHRQSLLLVGAALSSGLPEIAALDALTLGFWTIPDLDTVFIFFSRQ